MIRIGSTDPVRNNIGNSSGKPRRADRRNSLCMIGRVYRMWDGIVNTMWLCPKISNNKVIWKIPEPSWWNIARIVSPTRIGVVGRALDARPYPYVFKVSNEVQNNDGREPWKINTANSDRCQGKNVITYNIYLHNERFLITIQLSGLNVVNKNKI